MLTTFTLIADLVIGTARDRLARARANGNAGYSTEAVVVTALLVALAIGAVAIITTKVMAKANSIDLG